MATYKYSFELKNDLSELKSLCRNLEQLAGTAGLSESCIQEINVGLDELFTNIVSYGFKDDDEHRIRFDIHLENDVLTICVEDDGVPFDPLEAEEPVPPADLVHAKIGGLGIHFIKKFMDDVRYDRQRGKNKLTLKKTISSKVDFQ